MGGIDHRRRLILAAIMTVVVLFAACGGNNGGSQTKLSAGDTPTAVRETDRATAPIAAKVIYTKQAASEADCCRAIVVYDLSAGRELSSFELGSGADYVQGVVAGNGRVIANLSHSIVSYAYDGTDARELRHALAGGGFINIAISPDKTQLAATETTASRCPTPRVGDGACTPNRDIVRVVVIDAVTGRESLSVRQSQVGTQAFAGKFAETKWRDDGRGFTVTGAYLSEPGAYFIGYDASGLATIMLDGTARIDATDQQPIVAPDGRHSADGQFTPPCRLGGPIEMHDLRIRDLDLGQVIAQVHAADLTLAPLEWSPDNKEFLYSTFRLVTNPDLVDKPDQPICKKPDESTRTWHVVLADGSGTRDETDPYAVRRRWYGNRAVETRCKGALTVSSGCYSDDLISLMDISIGGVHIDDADNFHLAAFLDQ